MSRSYNIFGDIPYSVTRHSSSCREAHAKQIAYAPQPTMWSTNKERETVPIPSDAERPVPDARRTVAGRSER
jgi:hypothetical protein